MKFAIQTKELLAGLNRVAPCINPRHLTPILQCFHLRLDNGSMYITGTDQEKTATTKVEVLDSPGEGSFCVDHRMLLGMVRNSIAPKVEFEIDEAGKVIHFNMDQSNYKLPLEEAVHFPTIDHMQPKEELGIDGGMFFEAIFGSKTPHQ